MCLHVLCVLVAKRKSLFDDKADEIQQLTFVVKQDIGTLNKQIAQLQEVSSPCVFLHCVSHTCLEFANVISCWWFVK